MQRKTIIKNINRIIGNKTGSININMLGIDKPIFYIFGNINQVIETINKDSVEVVSYVNETKIDNFDVSFDDLLISLLRDVFEIVNDFDTELNDVFDSCRDENF